MRGISWLAANQLAAQEGLCTVEWLSTCICLCSITLTAHSCTRTNVPSAFWSMDSKSQIPSISISKPNHITWTIKPLDVENAKLKLNSSTERSPQPTTKPGRFLLESRHPRAQRGKISLSLLGAFAKLRKASISFDHVCLSASLSEWNNSVPHRTHSQEIWNLRGFFENMSPKLKVGSRYDKNDGWFCTKNCVYLWKYFHGLFLHWEMLKIKWVQHVKTHNFLVE